MDFREPSALILTLPMDLIGGVQSKARFLAAHLNKYGYHVTIASYVGRSSSKDLNVGWVMSFFGKKGRIELCKSENDIQHIFVGSRFPGTEFTYTENSASWRRVLGYHNKIIAVGGTPLIAYPAASLGKKFILWCADDLTGDRRARMMNMSRSRRFIDKAWILPKLIQQQSVVLNSGMPLRGVSSYTVKRLHSHVRGLKADIGHLPIPIESEFFSPVPERKQLGTMGFAGRISDKRKNAVLLFEAFRELRLRGVVHELHIAGPLDDFSSKLIASIGLSGSVKFLGYLNQCQLRQMYQKLDVFAITSYQEGLGISGLEAMACGVPVVSTKCGGPEDFVQDGITGYLSASSPIEFADSVCRLLADQQKYRKISNECRRTVREKFSVSKFSNAFYEAWLSVWGEDYRKKTF